APASKAPQNDAKKPAEEEKEKACEQAKAEETQAAQPTSTPAPAPKPSVYKTNYEKDVVYLYQFSRTPLIPSLSPFCLKVETWLRLAGLKYEVSTDWIDAVGNVCRRIEAETASCHSTDKRMN
ncbi:Uncharacterized protein GBIM_14891, partial [Gryllus bimaculatus]